MNIPSSHILRLALFCAALFTSVWGHAQSTSTSSMLLDNPVDPAQLRAEFAELTNKLIGEYLETGTLSHDSLQAYQLLVGMAARHGVRLERTPLRTNDERNLGPALAIARLEALGFGYDRVYRLNLRKN